MEVSIKDIEEYLKTNADTKWSAFDWTSGDNKLSHHFYIESDIAIPFLKNLLTCANNFDMPFNLNSKIASIDSYIYEDVFQANMGFSGILRKNKIPETIFNILFHNTEYLNEIDVDTQEGFINDITKINFQKNINFLMEHMPYQKRMWSYIFDVDFKDNFFHYFLELVTKHKKEIIDYMVEQGYSFKEAQESLSEEVKVYQKPALHKFLDNKIPDSLVTKKIKL